MNALISLCEKILSMLICCYYKIRLRGHLHTVSRGLMYEHSIHATLNAALEYGPASIQCIAAFYVPFHTGLGIIKLTSLLQQFVSESRKRWGWVGVNTR